MSDWSPPQSDLADDTASGEGINAPPYRVSPATQAARDRAGALLRATYDTNPDYEDASLAKVEPVVAKNAGGKSLATKMAAWAPPSQDLQPVAFKPPEADAEAAPAPTFADQMLAPWKGETISSLAGQNMLFRLNDYAVKLGQLQVEINKEQPDLGPLELAAAARQQYKEKYGTAPELSINWSELPGQLMDQIVKTPALFVSNLIKGLIVDPELLAVGTTGLPVKIASTAGRAAARAGEVGAQMGAQGAAISAAEQLQKTGEIQLQPALQAGAQTAGMGLVLGAFHAAVDTGLKSVAEGKEVPPAAEKEFAKRFDDKVTTGTPADQAMAQTMREAGMSPEEAQRMGAAVAPLNKAIDDALRYMEPEGEPHAATEGEVTQGDRGQYQGTGIDRTATEASNRNLAESRGEIPPQDEGQQPGSVADRRQDLERRAAVADMTPDEMRQALLTDPLTGLPNRRAYVEADKKPIQSSIDVDGLKWINDNLGHESGDRMLQAVGKALGHVDAYHISGDEFMAQFDSRADAEAGMAKFHEALQSATIDYVAPNGDKYTINKIGASHGIGESFSEADTALQQNKFSRQEAGLRSARGDEPPGLSRQPNRAAPAEADVAAARGNDQAGGNEIPDQLRQAGKVDPKLLALLAVPGIGASVGYWIGGNTPEKIRDALIAGGIGAAALTLGKVRWAALRVVDAIADKRYNPKEMFNKLEDNTKLGRLAGYQISESLKELVPSARRRSELTFALEAGKLDGLKPAEREFVEGASKAMRAVRDKAVEQGIDMGQIIDNYATHAYQRGLNSKEGLVQNLLNIMSDEGKSGGGMSPKSRWAKQRVIPSLAEAIDRGLIPVTTDLAEIVRMYTDSVTRTVAVKNFLDTLKDAKMPTGEPLGVSGKNLEAEIKRRTDAALGREVKEGVPPAAAKLDADIANIKSPRDYVFINHPQLRDKLWHKDVAAPLHAMLDTSEPWLFTRMAHGLAIAAKMLTFSGSLFHAKSLVDAALGTTFMAFRRGALDKIRDPSNDLARLAVKSGLNIIDRPLESEVAPVRNFLRFVETKAPFGVGTTAKGIRMAQDGLNNFLWGQLHPTLKYNTWSHIFERATTDPGFFRTVSESVGRKLGVTPDWRGVGQFDIARMASEFTNDIFGGINWLKIANDVHSKYGRDIALALASPTGRRFMQIVALAPDWTVATARSMYKALPGMSEAQVGAMHRQYLLRQAIVYLTAYNAINNYFSGHNIWENKDPTMVDLGDGRRMQIAKHTMEPIHWLTQPAQQAWNKLGMPVKEPILQLFSKDWISLKGNDVGGPPIGNRVAHAASSFLPIPAKTLFGQGLGPAVSGALGAPIYGKTQEQATADAVERALGVYKQKVETGTKQRYGSEAAATRAAETRVHRQYEKQRQ